MAGPIFVTFNIKIKSESGQYEITSDLLGLNEKKSVFLLYDDFFSENEIDYLIPTSQKLAIKINEQNKTLSMAEEIMKNMISSGCNKETHLIAVGGGAIQDLATVVASLYMRGISWSYIPTTLMAMLDSCIGGKSSINIGKYKNIIGNIYPPEKVYITSNFVGTLSRVDLISGIAEAGKICYAESDESFDAFLGALGSGSKNSLSFLKLAEISLTSKKWFIEIDEFDKKERKLLNFGHTFGHALEAASDFKIPHGVAILIGMQVAINFAGLKLLKLEDFIAETFNTIKQDIGITTLSKIVFESAISKDKKHSSSQMFFILPNSNGRLELVGYERSAKLLEKCWDSLINSLKDMEVNYEIL
jgi:3-dehydroquinate synthase